MAVLHAKLRVPGSRRELVPRTRLLDRLPAAAGRMPRVVLVAAPAGFGKTTVLTQWLAHAAQGGLQTAWLSLDATDSAPERFLAHLLAAVQTLDGDLGRDAAALLRHDSDGVEAAVVSVINDLDIVAHPVIIVLDDYHLLTGEGVHAILRTLVENLPAQVTLALGTREDPPLPLARLRARGDLVELRAADLRFTAPEASQLLDRVVGATLPDAAAAAIETRTEGWAAGLQLAGLAVRAHQGEVDEFVEAFTGSHRFVIDYLVDEVLSGLAEPMQDFLRETSILDQLSGPLCDAVTGGSDGQRTLIELERSGLFVIALDDTRDWFRYHHLFAAALRAQLQAGDPGRVARLHGGAARWLARNGIPQDAMPHALAADDDELAADILELALPALRRDRDDRAIREWIERLPEATIRRRSLLGTVAAWARLSQGDLEGVGRWLDAAAAAPQDAAGPPERLAVGGALLQEHEDELRDVPAMIEVYRATVTQARGDTQATRRHARRALALTAPDRHLARAAASGYLGLAAWADGDLEVATDSFAEAIRSMRVAGNIADASGAAVVLAEMWRARGRAGEAQRLIRRALDEGEQSGEQTGVPASASTGDLHVALAALLVEAGALEEAEQHLDLARSLGDAGSFPENRYRRHAVAASLLHARGRLAEASTALDDAAERHLPGFLPDLEPIAARQARLRIAQGDLAAALEWARTDGIALEPADFGRSHRLLTLIRLRIAQHRADAHVELGAAEAVLEATISSADQRAQHALAAEARLLRAIVLDAQGDRAAVAELERALGTVDHGFARLFLDEEPAVTPLLTAIASSETSAARGRAAAIIDSSATAPASSVQRPAALADELSAREREVLRLLAGDLTGPEIAAHLYVSVNTLRTHTKHIFTKLGVSTRRAAVRAAAERGLI